MELKKFFPQRLKTLREDFNNGEGMSQETLANLIGMCTNTIARWETGEYAIRPQNIIDLSKAMCIPIGDFLPSQVEKKLDKLMIIAIDLSDKDLDVLVQYAKFLMLEREKN